MNYVVVSNVKEAKKHRGENRLLGATPYKTMRYCVEKNLVEGLLMVKLDDKLAKAMASSKVFYCVDLRAIKKEPKVMSTVMKAIKLCNKFKVEVQVFDRAGVDKDIIVSLLVCLGLEKKDAKEALK